MTTTTRFAALSGIAKANGNGAAIDLDTKVKVQDELGNASLEEIKAYADELDREGRRRLTWAAFTCMDYDTAVEIVKTVVIMPLLKAEEDKLLKAHDDRRAYLDDREAALEDKYEALEAEIHKLRANLERVEFDKLHLTTLNTMLRESLDDKLEREAALEAEVARLRKIEGAVKLLKSL